MASNQITLKLTIAWWLRYYIFGLFVMCRLTGMGLNEQRVEYWLRKAIRVKRERTSAKLAH